MGVLVFVDTNIFLDFYRSPEGPTSLSLLDHFKGNHDRIITTFQVEMEYKKNRQTAIMKALGDIKKPPKGTMFIPAFLGSSKPTKAIRTAMEKLQSKSEELLKRTAVLLDEPTKNDPVYKVAQRLFRARGSIHLHSTHSSVARVRRLARLRSCDGRPPRKRGDVTIGDAINWEWIVDCATATGDEVVVVSRDSDYGTTYKSKSYMNDWLLQEFRARVSTKRHVRLTTRLSEAFKWADIKVTRDEEEAEEELVRSIETNPSQGLDLGHPGLVGLHSGYSLDSLAKAFEATMGTSSAIGGSGLSSAIERLMEESHVETSFGMSQEYLQSILRKSGLDSPGGRAYSDLVDKLNEMNESYRRVAEDLRVATVLYTSKSHGAVTEDDESTTGDDESEGDGEDTP